MTFVAKTVRSTELYNENFNHFFTEKMNSITSAQKSLLPNDLAFKIFRRPEAATGMLNFNEKMWILANVFHCDIAISISDSENGLDKSDFNLALKAQRGKVTNGELLEDMRTHAAFVLSSKELTAALLYMSYVSCTGIYTLLKSHVPNANHKKNQKFIEEKAAFNKTVAFLINYEAIKRRITTDYGLNMPEWYALLYFTKEEEFAVHFYKRDFIYSYNSDKGNLFKGMQRIYAAGYLIKRRTQNKDRYTISAKGMDLLDRIFNNLLLKF